MSGGSFDYAGYKVQQFADELANKLDERGNMCSDGWQEPVWPPEVNAKLREIEQQARKVGRLMIEAEWLYSGDTGEDTFLARVKEIEK